jgi:hypothetical protein
MDETHTNPTISAANPGADARGVPEVSFVEALAHPACVFRHPQEVVHHPWFTDQEKRIILLSWVRDELAAEQLACKAAPELELIARTDAVIEALAHYDPRAADEFRSAAATESMHTCGGDHAAVSIALWPSFAGRNPG